jgi:tetratricopeptide (TPR) repeat protein
MLNEAIAEFQKAADLMGESRSSTLEDVGHAYAMLGKRSEALKILAQLKKRDYPSGYGMAIIYTGLGEKDQALEWLEKAYEDRSELLTWLKVDPRFDSLRSDERFIKLLRRVGLPP